MGNQYPAGVTEQDLINNGYQKLVNASKKFPNNSNTWAGIWRACDDVAQKKCREQFQNNPFVKLRNGTILSISNLIKKIRDNVDIGDVVGAIVDRFPDMADILKNNLITFAAAPPPLSLTDKGRAITALEGLKNCLEANCKKRLYLNIGRPIGGQCFKEFEYVPSPNLKNGPEGCRTLGICCLIDKEDCVSQISRLSCIILAEDENGLVTNFEWHKTDINCEDPENIWCPPPPPPPTTTIPPSGTTTTSTTSSTTTTTIPPSGSTTTTTSTIAPSGTTTTTTGTTTPNPFAQCASCDWPAMSSNMFLSEYYSLYNGYGLRSGIYENPPSTKNGVSWSYSQTLPPYTNWSLRQVYESVTDSLDQLDLTYTRSKYSLLACSGTGIIDITDSYISFTGSPMGCYGADNPLDFREVTMNGSGACPDDWNTYVGHIPSLPSSGLLEYGMFC
jgi:hypothetical protein